MANPNYTAEDLRKHLILSYWEDKAELGKNYIDWHTEDGKCGLTLFAMGGTFDIIIEKRD